MAARKTYHHGDLKSALVSATVRLLASTEASDLSLREVAREAGVTPGAPFHHYETKADLLVDVAIEGFVGLGRALAKADARLDHSPQRRLEQRILAYLRFSLAHGAHYRVMFSPQLRAAAGHARYDEVAREAFAGLVEAVRRLRADLSETAARQLAFTVWAGAHGAALLAVDGTTAALAGARRARGLLRSTARHLTRLVEQAQTP